MNEFKMQVLVSSFDSKTLETTIISHPEQKSKIIYNLDGFTPASKWVREETKNIATFDTPKLKTGISWNQKGSGNNAKNALGYFYNHSNKVTTNGTNVALFSQSFSDGHGLPVMLENFMKCCSLFAARKSVKSNWIIDKDEYMVPNTGHEDYQQWNDDAIVYSLFNTSSNQSSLRNVDYKGKTWNIENQWFWMSKADIKELANDAKNGSDDVWQDLKEFGEERYVYNKLQTIELSKDAKAILDLATKLVKDSFKYRKDFHAAHPEYQTNTWDAGWYQVKAIVKEYMPDELKKFNELYKKFQDRMRKGVYKFGFLKD